MSVSFRSLVVAVGLISRSRCRIIGIEGTVLIMFACLFILGYATTWGPIVWTIMGGLFPNLYSAKGMAVSMASNWLWNSLIGFFTPFY